ncbi:MAG TPA: nucleoside 2-deoxyribosyltransferase [Patescibacteria group bacterium]|nr:nucleoside 2-deoxyribosyltransferase [Patescibacteria group bacterium]
MRIYLAGPEVFLEHPLAIGEAKRALCADHGLTGVYPLDNQLDLAGLSPRDQGRAIYRANLALIRSCDVMIANITPFRGPSADVGTAFEMGAMAALGRPVLAYSNSAQSFARRVEAHFSGRVHRRADGMLADSQGLAIEEFDMVDNLMLHGALEEGELFLHAAAPGMEFTDLTAFEDCVRVAARMVGR